MAVRRYLLSFGTLGATRRRLGVPLHTGLVPTALAGRHARAATAAHDWHHWHFVEAIVVLDRRIKPHQIEPAPCAAMLASISFIHAS